jgi:hypothetical protein
VVPVVVVVVVVKTSLIGPGPDHGNVGRVGELQELGAMIWLGQSTFRDEDRLVLVRDFHDGGVQP